ncbi:hypothetical protein ACN47E_003320 [Coniothyrium glycines]
MAEQLKKSKKGPARGAFFSSVLQEASRGAQEDDRHKSANHHGQAQGRPTAPLFGLPDLAELTRANTKLRQAADTYRPHYPARYDLRNGLHSYTRGHERRSGYQDDYSSRNDHSQPYIRGPSRSSYRRGTSYAPSPKATTKEVSRLNKDPSFTLDVTSFQFIPQYNSKIMTTAVTLCKHKDFCIRWDSLDPDNRHGSWKAMIKNKLESSAQVKGESCACSEPDLFGSKRNGGLSKVLAQRMVADYGAIRAEYLSKRESQRKKMSRPGPIFRPGPVLRPVYVEVRTIMQYMFNKLDEKHLTKVETLSSKQHAEEWHERMEEVREKQRRKNEPVELPEPAKSAPERTAVLAMELTRDFIHVRRKGMKEPSNRYNHVSYKNVCVEEQEGRSAEIVDEGRKKSANQNLEPRKTHASSRSVANVDSKTLVDNRTSPQPQPRQKAKGRVRFVVHDSDSDDITTTAQSKKINSASTLQKSGKKSLDMTEEERALLAGIQKAQHKDATEQNKAEQEAEVVQTSADATPAPKDLESEEDDEAVKALAALTAAGAFSAAVEDVPKISANKDSSSKSTTKKRKTRASDTMPSGRANKKSRRQHKSVEVIEDMDEEQIGKDIICDFIKPKEIPKISRSTGVDVESTASVDPRRITEDDSLSDLFEDRNDEQDAPQSADLGADCPKSEIGVSPPSAGKKIQKRERKSCDDSEPDTDKPQQKKSKTLQ